MGPGRSLSSELRWQKAGVRRRLAVSGKRIAAAVCLLALVLGAWAELPEREPVSVEPPVRIGLALSGGAALGFAHIGVLKQGAGA